MSISTVDHTDMGHLHRLVSHMVNLARNLTPYSQKRQDARPAKRHFAGKLNNICVGNLAELLHFPKPPPIDRSIFWTLPYLQEKFNIALLGVLLLGMAVVVNMLDFDSLEETYLAAAESP